MSDLPPLPNDTSPYQTLHLSHHFFQVDTPDCLIIHLNRPEVKNALNPQMITDLIHVFTEHASHPSIRLILIHGEGNFFCAGADLTWMKQAASYTPDQNEHDAHHLASVFEAIDHCPKPTIAFIQGGAFGGGVGLAAACDLAIAQESSLFCLSEVRLGLIPAVISPHLIRAMGYRNALRLALTAERLSGREAHQLGLVTHVYPDDQAAKGCIELMNALLKGSSQAHASTKDLFKSISLTSSLDQKRKLTTSAIAAARASDDGKEGMNAFLEKRPPHWVRQI